MRLFCINYKKKILAVFRFFGCDFFTFRSLDVVILLTAIVLDIVLNVEVSKHVQEETSIQRKQEVNELRIVTVVEHNAEVVVEDYAELDLKTKIILLNGN